MSSLQCSVSISSVVQSQKKAIFEGEERHRIERGTSMQSVVHRTPPMAPQFEIGFGTIADIIRRWTVENRTRSALSALPDRQLADLGIDRADIGRIARASAETI